MIFKTKNIIAVIIVAALLAAGYFISTKFKNSAVISTGNDGMVQSIALLPFTNNDADSGNVYFSDGLSDGILNSLARVKGLKVCARTSSFQFRGKEIDIKQAGARLGVQTILEGSFQLQGDKIMITTKLINVKDGLQFWSAQFDENINDIFRLQDMIAKTVAKKLSITQTTEDDLQSSKKQLTSKIAYDLYLQGRSFWNLRTAPSLTKAIDFFQKAITLESSFARAYSGIADCYTALGYGSFLAPKDAFPKAQEAAKKALALDPALAEPNAVLGYYKFYYEWDWAAAEQEFRMAIAKNPNYEIAYDYYGYYLTAMKRYEEARVILTKAQELDPLSVPISTDIGFSFYYSGDYSLAKAKLQATLKMNSKFVLARIWLGRTFQVQKNYPEAVSEYKKALEFSSSWPVALAAIGNVYGESGDKAAARNVLDTLAYLSSKKYVTSYGVALVYAGLDEKDMAFRYLSKAFDERSHWLVWLRTDPRWSSLQSDIRFAKLVSSVGLPD